MKTRDQQDRYDELRGWLQRQYISSQYDEEHPDDAHGDAELEYCSDEIAKLCREILGDKVVRRDKLSDRFLVFRDRAIDRAARIAWEHAAEIARTAIDV